MTRLESRMRQWLAGGTERQRQHAALRLALPFPEESPPREPAPARSVRWLTPHRPGPYRGRVRVGHLMPVGHLGGAERLQLTLARSLDSRLANAGVVVYHPDAIRPLLAGEFAPMMPLGSGIEAARELASACEVLVTWGTPPLGDILRGLEPRPRVVSISHSPTHPDCRYCNEIYADTTGIDHIVAVHESALGPVPDAWKPRAEVIYNCVDATRMVATVPRDVIRDGLGVPRDARMVAYVGRLSGEKRPLAVAEIAAADPALHVVIAGEGLERPKLDAFRAGHDVPNLHLIGGNTDVGSILAAADVFVSPSDYESFGLSVAEACWMNCPVVTTRCGIALSHKVATRIVPFGASGPELADAVREVFRFPAETARRAARAQAIVRTAFHPEVFAARWSDYLVARAAESPRQRHLPCIHREDCGCERPGCAIGAGDLEGGKKCSVTHLLEACTKRVIPDSG